MHRRSARSEERAVLCQSMTFRSFELRLLRLHRNLVTTPGGHVLLTTRSGTNDWHGGVFEYFRNDVHGCKRLVCEERRVGQSGRDITTILADFSVGRSGKVGHFSFFPTKELGCVCRLRYCTGSVCFCEGIRAGFDCPFPERLSDSERTAFLRWLHRPVCGRFFEFGNPQCDQHPDRSFL